MLKLFVGSHGPLASGVLGAVEVLLGKQRSITTFDAYVDESDLTTAVDEFFASVGRDDQVVLISDLYGGSVNTALCGYLDRPNTTLIAGANLAIVLALALEPQPLGAERIEELIRQARDSLRLVQLEPLTEPEDDENFFNE